MNTTSNNVLECDLATLKRIELSMTKQTLIKKNLVVLKDKAPAGYALALHVHFTAPTFLLQTYDRKWLEYYSKQGLVMTDPIVRWGFENRGYKFWADLEADDPAGVLKAAADHGLGYGVVCSVGTDTSFSIGGFARNDRAYTEQEADELSAIMEEVHGLTDNLKVLSPETAAELTKLSIEYTHPGGS